MSSWRDVWDCALWPGREQAILEVLLEEEQVLDASVVVEDKTIFGQVAINLFKPKTIQLLRGVGPPPLSPCAGTPTRSWLAMSDSVYIGYRICIRRPSATPDRLCNAVSPV